jgi:hypothetical protein
VAKRVRDTLHKLEKQKDIANLVFDTTGVGYFEVLKKAPEIAELNAMLAKEPACKGVTIRSLKEVEMPKAEVVYELTVSGLG